MNKDVVYLEPEDDITDIIAKIEKAKEKIIALVPPKKAGVLRSIVNIKLIAKSGVNAGKNVVLVTADPSIMRLAATAKIPVAKNLQSAPVIPDPATIEVDDTVSSEDVLEETPDEKKAEEGKEETEENGEKEEKEAEQGDGKKDDKKSKKGDKKARPTSQNPVIAWFQTHKKIAIGGAIGLVVFILLLIWAFAIAPAVSVTVSVRTITSNFSENITFTSKMADEKVSDGLFYLETKKLEEKAEVAFEATGKKNVGEKAHGEIVIFKKFRVADGGGTVAVNAGTSFTIDDLVFTADTDSTISWDGDLKALKDDCENYNEPSFNTNKECLVSRAITVTAENPGERYNIAASATAWSTSANVGAYSTSAMEGGTDKMITVVQQSDIDTAMTKLKAADEAAAREKLISSIPEGSFAIESSFSHVVGEPTSTPKIGEEVKDKEKPKLTVTTTDSIFIVDKTKVEEFISEKAKLTENYKIYNINNPFVENFTQTESGYIGKLKASYVSGPKVTENEIVEIIKGKGLGVAQHDIKDIDGISTIRIDTSYPWVMSIPDDPNKITVSIEVEE